MTDIDRLIGFMAIMQVPFMNDPDALMYIEEVKVALKTLKAQEPRVLTLKEVLDRFATGEPWYCEVNKDKSESEDGWELPIRAIKHEILSLRSDFIHHNTYQVFSETNHYGIVWRCWTSRPTDEQRKAVKWDE